MKTLVPYRVWPMETRRFGPLDPHFLIINFVYLNPFSSTAFLEAIFSLYSL